MVYEGKTTKGRGGVRRDAPLRYPLGSGDADAFGYDVMGRMNSYQLNVSR